MSADRLAVSGGMTMTAARTLLKQGVDALAAGEPLFDLAGVSEVDSAGLAVVFGWQRAALSQGRNLRMVNMPPSLLSLAEVYGVVDLLPQS